MKIKGAIFDMDGTLVDSLSFWDVLWGRIGERYLGVKNFKPSEEVDKSVRTMIFSQAMGYVKDVCGINASVDEITEFGTSSLADFYRDVVGLKYGARELLDALEAKGIKMCLATATDMKYVNIALDKLDLRKYFDAIMSCADIGKGKDQPDIYLNASNALGFDREDICVFEDSYVALETAKAIDLKTIGIFDKNNFGQDRLEKASIVYLGENRSLAELVKEIEA